MLNMYLPPLTYLESTSVSLLLASLILLWLPWQFVKVKCWQITLVLSFAVAMYAKLISLQGLYHSAILSVVVTFYFYCPRRYFLIKTLAWFALVAMIIFFVLYHPPGFQVVNMIPTITLNPDSLPYHYNMRIEKLIFAIVMLANLPRLRSWSEWRLMLVRLAPIIVMTLLLVIGFAVAIGYVRFDPKLSSYFIIWSLLNLLLTCPVEETIFRGVIQASLMRCLQHYRYGSAVALVLAACLFGLHHYAGDINYMVLATIAGLCYGYAYQRTKRIEAAILTHYTLNATHFLLFSYPVLAGT